VTSCCGIDVSSQKGIAFGWIDENGRVTHRKVHLDLTARGGRRLVQARLACHAIAVRQMGDTACGIIEIPWASRDNSFVLLSLTGVVLEAVQAGAPHVAMMEVPTGQWKGWSVGRGNATAPEYQAHAKALGYDGNDEDIAAAVCMAQAAWNRYDRRLAA
jgi:hypothetical protein